MKSSRRIPAARLRERIPHVALLIETSLGPGRDILRGIARFLREHGRWSIFHQPRNLTDPFPAWLRQWDGDGIIARIQDSRMAELVARTGIPSVDVLGVAQHPRIPLVHVDDTAVARRAAEHLLERGFQHFAFFGITGENWSENRRSAFARCVEEHRGTCAVYEVPRARLELVPWETQENELAAWVAQLPKPVGLMACTDICGPLLLEACRRSAVQVPDEVAVVSVNNDEPLCELCDPPLSSVQCNHFQVGYAAAELLEQLMRRPRVAANPVYIQPLGVVARHSTDVMAIADTAVSAAVRYIREHATEGIRVDQVVRSAGVSRSVLQRRFRSLLGRTLHDEILQCRIKRATQLLTQTNLSLPEVAEQAGFKHQQYLGEVFRRHVGRTPARLRKEAPFFKWLPPRGAAG